MGRLGAGFDCASRNEMELVLSQGFPAENIVFANPIKRISDVQYAREVGVKRMTVDSEAELRKTKQWFPDAQLIVRCAASDPSASYSFKNKFGSSQEMAIKLLHSAKALDLSVIGLAFHVGSGAKNSRAFDDAIGRCRDLFKAGMDVGHEMRLLDIGGGFSQETFTYMAKNVKHSIAQNFNGINVEVVAEPGRYIVQGAMTAACQIIAQRDAIETGSLQKQQAQQEVEPLPMLYLNDGMYGIFHDCIFEPVPQPHVLRSSNKYLPPAQKKAMQNYTIWGPTLDELDCLFKKVELPAQLAIGDWIYFPNMGAYTTCLATGFNGFERARDMLYVSSDPQVNVHLQQRGFDDMFSRQCRI